MSTPMIGGASVPNMRDLEGPEIVRGGIARRVDDDSQHNEYHDRGEYRGCDPPSVAPLPQDPQRHADPRQEART
ncbi:MAG: hypothetical protein ACREV4_11980 [Gammaproteobacteria bacterium]